MCLRRLHDDIFTTVFKSQALLVESLFIVIAGALTSLAGRMAHRFVDTRMNGAFNGQMSMEILSKTPTFWSRPATALRSSILTVMVAMMSSSRTVRRSNASRAKDRGCCSIATKVRHAFARWDRHAGLNVSGWAQAACAADFDNDGKIDVAVTYYGLNRLFRNVGGRFQEVTEASGLPVSGTRWGSGCAWVDYDRDGFVDLFVANYVDLDLKTTPKAGQRPECVWKGIPVMCGPVGLPKALNVLYRNRGDGTFEDVSAKAGLLKPGGRYGLGVAVADFNNDGWPDIYVACDQTPSLLYENKRDGTFVERG